MGVTRSSWERADTSEGSSYLSQILKLHNAGFPSTFIAKKFGKDHTTILYHLRKLGVPRGLGRGYRRPMVAVSVMVISTTVQAQVRIPKTSPYDHLFEEPICQGKSYKEYLKASGRTPKEIKKMLADKAKAARWGGTLASLPTNLHDQE